MSELIEHEKEKNTNAAMEADRTITETDDNDTDNTDEDNWVISTCAPGKVLLAGGYTVLERPNVGLVLSASNASLHCSICVRGALSEEFVLLSSPSILREWFNEEMPIKDEKVDNLETPKQCFTVNVYSPQFASVSCYRIDYSSDSHSVEVLAQYPQHHQSNRLVEETLKYTFIYIRQCMPYFQEYLHQLNLLQCGTTALVVQLRGENDFYSQTGNQDLPPFWPLPIQNERVVIHKTGLGSSAALVTCLVACLLKVFGLADDLPLMYLNSREESEEEICSDSASRMIVHNLAQICHCAAQESIGSGFDISAACFGSQTYTRFSPETLANVDASNLVDLVHSKWDQIVEPISLPRGLQLLLADVCGGSCSPGMARKVMQWKKTAGSDHSVWQQLVKVNGLLKTSMQCLGQLSFELQRLGKSLALQTVAQWQVLADNEDDSETDDYLESRVCAKALVQWHFLMSRQRSLMKQLGQLAGVDIEPNVQTELCDYTNQIPGVVSTSVPGAGGMDALCVVYLDVENTRELILESWRQWNETHSTHLVNALNVKASPGGGVYETDLDF